MPSVLPSSREDRVVEVLMQFRSRNRGRFRGMPPPTGRPVSATGSSPGVGATTEDEFSPNGWEAEENRSHHPMTLDAQVQQGPFSRRSPRMPNEHRRGTGQISNRSSPPRGRRFDDGDRTSPPSAHARGLSVGFVNRSDIVEAMPMQQNHMGPTLQAYRAADWRPGAPHLGDSRTNPASTAGTAQHDLDLVNG